MADRLSFIALHCYAIQFKGTYDHLDSTRPHSLRLWFHANKEHARSIATANQSIPPGTVASIRDLCALFLANKESQEMVIEVSAS
jgi:hypothetical protein